jgi:hypothetical protein
MVGKQHKEKQMNAQANATPALIIFDTVTMRKPRELDGSYETMRGAKSALTRYKKKVAERIEKNNARIDAGGLGQKTTLEEATGNLIIGTYADFARLDYDVPTHNMLNPEAGEFMIKRSLKGTSCDPATERYHTM